jgi:HEAT repeat protein
MRLLGLLLFSAVALGHGEGSRSQSGPTGPVPTGQIIVPIGGGKPDGSPGATTASGSKRHTWEIWWAYHRDYYLAELVRGNPVTGVRALEDRKQRKEIREGRLYDILLAALEDAHHEVRAAAAIALGKFGNSKGVRNPLERHIHQPPEGWFDVREAATYGTGLLAFTDNRGFLNTIVNDRHRPARERSMGLVGFLMDGSQASADELRGHARYVRSGIRAGPEADPHRAEQECRRFAIHLLGFVELPGYDDFLWQVAMGGRGFEGAEQGLAVTALGRRRARDYKEPLFRMLYERDWDKQVTRSVPIALGLMLKPEDTDDLKRLARFIRDQRSDTIAQSFAVMALGQVGGDTAVELLREILSDRVFGDKEDCAFVYLALGLCGKRSKAARETLLAEYGKADNDTEQSVLALACGIGRVAEAVPITIEALDNPRKRDTSGLGARGRFAGWASLALGFHGDPRGLDPVRRVFGSNNEGVVREQSAIAISLLQRSAAVPELLAILKDAGTLQSKAAVVAALGVLPEPQPDAVDGLISVYKDDSMPNDVRGMAISALGALADPRSIPVSALLSRNYNYLIRCLALDEVGSYL